MRAQFAQRAIRHCLRGDNSMLLYLQMIETDEDKSKFEEIYRAYRNLMYYIAYTRLHHTQDAEDAVHHVFIKIAEGRHPTEEYNDALQTALSASEDGEAFLVTCILKLPERQRMVIWLKYYYGYTLREIASMLDISLVSAQKLDQRAKKKLEELYKNGDEMR